MNFETVAVIYIVKNNVAIDVKISKWRNKFYHSSPDYQWDRRAIEKIMHTAIADYLMHCDDIKQEINRYFLYRDEFFIHNEFDAMRQFIHGIRIKRNDEYINGFDEQQFADVLDSMEDI